MTIEPGSVLRADALGVTLEIRATGASTGGEYAEFDVVGRPRGLIALPHVHDAQAERHEVVEGVLRLKIDGRERRLAPGDAMTVPAGARHSQRPGKEPGPMRVRVRHEPAGNSDAFVERLAELSATGGYDRFGMPKPKSAARLVRDFAEHHAPFPPVRVQHALSRALLRRGA
jgi:mannose-6-phosphate isomerase-like protein (cupin superfamily)